MRRDARKTVRLVTAALAMFALIVSASLPAAARPVRPHCNHRVSVVPLRAAIIFRTQPFLETGPAAKTAVITEAICTRVRWEAGSNGGAWVVIPGSRRVQWRMRVNEGPGGAEDAPPLATMTIGKPD